MVTKSEQYRKVREIFNEEMEKNNLTGWGFEFMKRKRSVGLCNYNKRIIYYSVYAIEANEEEIRDVARHEIAHALVGRGYGHGRVWKRKAVEIGCRASAHTERNIIKAEHKYEVYCKNGCFTQKYFRKPKIEGYICKKCEGEISLRRI